MTRVNEEIRYTSDCDHSACRYAIFKSIENDFDEDEDFDLSKQNQELEIATAQSVIQWTSYYRHTIRWKLMSSVTT